MNKSIRVALNILVFAVIIGFVWYMVRSLGKGDAVFSANGTPQQDEAVSPYKKINSFQVKAAIISFDLLGGNIYIATNQAVMILNKSGALIRQIPIIGKEIRDIKVEDGQIYLLYPAEIEVFTNEGERVAGWTARRNNADYCSLALSSEYIFVTDAENKHICKYTKDGEFIAIIISPNGFVIPSFAFDIMIIQDTLYCSNSGRLQIERYTLAGKYIDAFGKSGGEAGSFAGCCNPSYLAATQNGDIITSEKGNPRISCYGRDGAFRTILLNSKILGGGVKAYNVKVQDDTLYVAGKNTLSEYVFDPKRK